MRTTTSLTTCRHTYYNNFLDGLASIFDIGSTSGGFEIKENPLRTDAESLSQDWVKVGEALHFAARTIEDEIKTEESKQLKLDL